MFKALNDLFIFTINASLREDFQYYGFPIVRNARDFKGRCISLRGRDAVTASIARDKFHGTNYGDIIVVYEIANNPSEIKPFLNLKVVYRGREESVRFARKKVELTVEGAKLIAKGLHRLLISHMYDVTTRVNRRRREGGATSPAPDAINSEESGEEEDEEVWMDGGMNWMDGWREGCFFLSTFTITKHGYVRSVSLPSMPNSANATLPPHLHIHTYIHYHKQTGLLVFHSPSLPPKERRSSQPTTTTTTTATSSDPPSSSACYL